MWVKNVLNSSEQVDILHTDTWEAFKPFGYDISAMRWLVQQIRHYNPEPPKQPLKEAKFYILAAFCPDNRILGFLIDTYRFYYRSCNRHGVLSCVHIISTVNRYDEYPHLNFIYNVMIGCTLREYRNYLYKVTDFTFLSDKDFRTLGKLLPEFKPFEFRERIQVIQHKITWNTTSEDLARECYMSGVVFRKRFKQEFGIAVSEWLRKRRKEHIENMLVNTDLPLYMVAENNGFNTPSAFSDYCRRNFSQTPSQIRKNNKEL